MSKWEVKTIGEICDLGVGKVQTGPFGSQLHQSDYQAEGYPFIMPKDIINGKINESSVARVSINHVERLSKHKLLLGDIIYGRRGDIGRQALARKENIGWLCGSGCLRIRLGNAPVDYTFLHYYLKLPEVMSWVENQAIGATMPNLNTKILRSVPVRYPSNIDHQKKIVAIVSAYNDLIENNDRRITLLEKMAEEIYREWFVRLRFPGHEQTTFHKGIPEGWEMVKIAKAFEMTGGGTPSKDENTYWTEGEINWYTPSDITASNGIFLFNSGLQCTQERLNNSSARLFPAYSIMMTSRATIGAIGINTTSACTNQGFIGKQP
jgi:type I restriction enzyme, S subunit